MALEGIRPPELPITRSFSSNSIIILYDPVADKTFQISAQDLGLHYRNRDNGTTGDTFEIQYQSQNQDSEGDTLLVLRGLQGGGYDVAFRNHWDAVAGTKVTQFCNDYTGTGSDVWEDLKQGIPKRPTKIITGDYTITEADHGLTLSYEESALDGFIYVPNGLAGLDIIVVQRNNKKFTIAGDPSDIPEVINYQNNYTSKGPNSAMWLRSFGYDYGSGFQTIWIVNDLDGGSSTQALAQRTGTVIKFDAEADYGTEATPETGNIIVDVTDAKRGITALITHKDGTAPTFSSEFHKLSGSGDYVLGVNNYILCEYRSATRINYSISQ